MADHARKCDQCGAPVRVRPPKAAAAKGARKKLSDFSEANIPTQEDVEKSLREETFMDPVFFKEAGGDVDVEAIIKIARGEETGAAEEAGTEDDRPTAVISNPELDMAAYLESLPLIEKARRKFSASHHRRAEAADEKRMRRQLERASRHFAAEEAAGERAEADRAEQARRRRERALAEKEKAERAAAEEARRREERALAGKAEAERAAAEEARRREERAFAEKAEAERAAAEEARRLEERALADRLEAERAAAEAVSFENTQEVPDEEATIRLDQKAAAARRQEEELRAQRAQADRPEVIRLQNRDRAAAIRRREEQAAAEAGAELIAAQQAAAQQENAAAAENTETAHVQAAASMEQQIKETAYQQTETSRAEKFLNLGPADHTTYTRLEEHTHKALAPRERSIEEQRRRRRHRANKPDRIDEFLGRYGLSKEMSVRIATLFLIAILSVIYVLGRGSSGASSDTSYAGEGMTGSEIIQDQGVDGRQTEPSQGSDQTDLPTGGGDFQNN